MALSNRKIQDNLRDGMPYPYTEQDGIDYISSMISADENETFAFAITVDDKAVGSIGVFRQDNIHRQTAELGYYIAEKYWGKGLIQLCVFSVQFLWKSSGLCAILLDLESVYQLRSFQSSEKWYIDLILLLAKQTGKFAAC